MYQGSPISPSQIKRSSIAVLTMKEPTSRLKKENIQNTANSNLIKKSLFHGLTGIGVNKLPDISEFDFNGKSKHEIKILSSLNEFQKMTKTGIFSPDPASYLGPDRRKKVEKQTHFLNISNVVDKEINNPVIKQYLDEVNRRGPKFQYCKSCNNHNIDYFNEMKPENSIKIINQIRRTRVGN